MLRLRCDGSSGTHEEPEALLGAPSGTENVDNWPRAASEPRIRGHHCAGLWVMRSQHAQAHEFQGRSPEGSSSSLTSPSPALGPHGEAVVQAPKQGILEVRLEAVRRRQAAVGERCANTEQLVHERARALREERLRLKAEEAAVEESRVHLRVASERVVKGMLGTTFDQCPATCLGRAETQLGCDGAAEARNKINLRTRLQAQQWEDTCMEEPARVQEALLEAWRAEEFARQAARDNMCKEAWLAFERARSECAWSGAKREEAAVARDTAVEPPLMEEESAKVETTTGYEKARLNVAWDILLADKSGLRSDDKKTCRDGYAARVNELVATTARLEEEKMRLAEERRRVLLGQRHREVPQQDRWQGSFSTPRCIDDCNDGVGERGAPENLPWNRQTPPTLVDTPALPRPLHHASCASVHVAATMSVPIGWASPDVHRCPFGDGESEAGSSAATVVRRGGSCDEEGEDTSTPTPSASCRFALDGFALDHFATSNLGATHNKEADWGSGVSDSCSTSASRSVSSGPRPSLSSRGGGGRSSGGGWAPADWEASSQSRKGSRPRSIPHLQLGVTHGDRDGGVASSEVEPNPAAEVDDGLSHGSACDAEWTDPRPIPAAYLSAISAVMQDGWHEVYDDSRSEWTALHWAASQGRADICARLLKAAADPRQSDHSGHSALDHAAGSGDETTLRLLAEAARRSAT